MSRCTGNAPRLHDYLKPGRSPWSDAYNETDLHPDRCIVCGRVTASDTRILVAFCDGGDYRLLPTADADHINHPGYMGLWPVGRECGKNIPAEYRMQEADV